MRGLSVSIIFFLPIYDDVHIYSLFKDNRLDVYRKRKEKIFDREK